MEVSAVLTCALSKVLHCNVLVLSTGYGPQLALVSIGHAIWSTHLLRWQRWRGGNGHTYELLVDDNVFFFILHNSSNCLILDKIPTLVLFFSLQSGEGHSQWAWPFTFIQVAPNLQTNSSQEVGASGPTEEMLQTPIIIQLTAIDSDSSSCWEMWSQIKVTSAWIFYVAVLHLWTSPCSLCK